MTSDNYIKTNATGSAVMAEPPCDFGVYVHWPFCAAKCPYCDFNSHVATRPIDQGRYEAAYLSEISYWDGEFDRLTVPLTGEADFDRAGASHPSAGPVFPSVGPVTSIFFGGGTPSLMAPSLVEAILEKLEAVWGFAPDIEITLEANPQSVDASNFRALKAAGVNRLSIGVQSFDDKALKALGRLHNADEARAAIETAKAVFDRFSFDLIYARPGQSLDEWGAELDEALLLGARHLSLYQLTIEPNTAYQLLYNAGKLKLPDQDMASDFYGLAQEKCAAAGLPSYEVSNHAVPGEEARHNLTYWRYGDYVGIGPGAHGRVTMQGQRLATVTEALPTQWLTRVEKHGHGLRDVTAIDRHEQAIEMLLMGMRVREGLFLPSIYERTGYDIEMSVIDELTEAGLLVPRDMGGNAATLRATERGVLLLNRLTEGLAAGLVDLRGD